MNALDYTRIIQPDKVEDVFTQIEAVLLDIHTCGQAVENAYGNKGQLLKEIAQLEGEIDIKEAEAFMQLDGDTVTVDGKSIKLSNDKLRDFYRKFVSRVERRRLAEKEAELKQIDVEIFKAKDRWEETKKAADLLEAKAYAQGNLFKFLSRGE